MTLTRLRRAWQGRKLIFMLLSAVQGWNLRRLDSMLSRTLDKHKVQIPGVSTPFLYFGMWRSIFAW